MDVVNALLYSGKSAVISDVASLKAMLANDEPEVEIVFNDNVSLSSNVTVPAGKKVTLDLAGNTVNAAAVGVYANGGEVVVKNGEIHSAGSEAVTVRNGGSLVVENATLVSDKANAVSASDGEVTVNGGKISAQECGVVGFKNSTITINDGEIVGIDNSPISGNGSAAGKANDGTNMNVVMNGGKIVAHIQSAGYQACGVYVPNSGSFTMNDGEIVSDGAGIVMRGGKVTLNGGKITANGAAGATGKVGDSRVVVGSYAVVYDANSRYPAKDTLELVVGKDMILEGTDGDIQILLEKDSDVANITDNRG